MTKICAICGQPIRPSLNLTAAEMKELDSLAERDWREWAKRVIELSDPNMQKARSVLLQICDGTISVGESAKARAKALAKEDKS